MPLLTSPATYSKCGVPPRMTQPRATTPAYWPPSATRRTRPGSSKVPGTRKTSMSASATPWRISASWAPLSRCSVMKPLKRDTQSANRPCGGVRKPSITRAMSVLLLSGPALQARPGEGNLLHDLESVALQAHDLLGIVGQKAQSPQPQVLEDLRPHPELAETAPVAPRPGLVGLHPGAGER